MIAGQPVEAVAITPEVCLQILILWAAMSADASVGDKTEKVKFWLGTGTRNKIALVASQHADKSFLAAAKKQFELVDGSDAEQKDLRNKLFDISGKRAVYPQVCVALAPVLASLVYHLGRGCHCTKVIE